MLEAWAPFAMSETDKSVKELLQSCAFDPASVVAKAFDFSNFKVKDSNKEKKKESKEGKDGGEESQKLPKRLKLAAFSKTIGHRPTGLQIEQCKLYVKRFPKEFRLMSMGKLVLPHKENYPYICPDGHLPAPVLSTLNALRYLNNHRDDLKTGEPRAVKEIEMCLNDGVQVEWVAFNSFLEWMLYIESSSVQVSVRVHPHIVDTAIMYVQFLGSTQALPWVGPSLQTGDAANAASTSDTLAVATGIHSKQLEGNFMSSMRGQSVHRLKDAKRLLQNCEPAVVADFAAWRKKVHFVHANAFAQSYMLATEEWCAAKDQVIIIQGKQWSLQNIILQIAKRLIAQSDITWDAEVPKVRRAAMTASVFRDVCITTVSGTAFITKARSKFGSSWTAVGAAEKLARRLVVDGEASLREIFVRALSMVHGNVDTLDFSTTDPGSDFCTIFTRLQEAWQKAAEAEAQQKAAAAAEAQAAAKAAAAKAALEEGSAAKESTPGSGATTETTPEGGSGPTPEPASGGGLAPAPEAEAAPELASGGGVAPAPEAEAAPELASGGGCPSPESEPEPSAASTSAGSGGPSAGGAGSAGAPGENTASLRMFLPEDWSKKFGFGGIADVCIAESPVVWAHRIEVVSAQVMAHAALSTLLATVGVQAEDTLAQCIIQVQNQDLIGSGDFLALRALNREANVAKHQPVRLQRARPK